MIDWASDFSGGLSQNEMSYLALWWRLSPGQEALVDFVMVVSFRAGSVVVFVAAVVFRPETFAEVVVAVISRPGTFS